MNIIDDPESPNPHTPRVLLSPELKTSIWVWVICQTIYDGLDTMSE